MLLGAKRIAFLGLLLAVTVLLVVLGGILESSTFFLLAGASFCVGIAIREGGLRLGVGFFIASILLSLILAPNKLYCITFSGMGFYIVVVEYFWEKLLTLSWNKNRKVLFGLIKFIAFNSMYVPLILFLPGLFFPGNISNDILIGLLLGGQLVLVIYDQAYRYFQKTIWGKLRGYLHLR